MPGSGRWSGTRATRLFASTTGRFRSRSGEPSRRRSGRDRARARRADPRAGLGTVGPAESAGRAAATRAVVRSLDRGAVAMYDFAVPGLRNPVRSALVGRRSGVPRRGARAVLVRAAVLRSARPASSRARRDRRGAAACPPRPERGPQLSAQRGRRKRHPLNLAEALLDKRHYAPGPSRAHTGRVTAPRPQIRIGYAERSAAQQALDEHLTAGRLDPAEYADRYAAAEMARTRAEVVALFTGGPSPHPLSPVPVQRVSASPAGYRRDEYGYVPEEAVSRIPALVGVVLAVLLVFPVAGAARLRYIIVVPRLGCGHR